MAFRYYEDFAPGEVIDLGSYFVSSEEVIEFAKEFDPAPFHLDAGAGQRNMLGGLAASGWHVCAMGMRMMCDSFLMESSGQGAPGIENCDWKRPVLAGMTLSGKGHVVSKRLSQSRPGIGLVNFRFEFSTDNEGPACVISNAIMFGCKGDPLRQGGRS